MACARTPRVELGRADANASTRGDARATTRARDRDDDDDDDDDALPLGWRARVDEGAGRWYYYNKTLGVSTWTRPREVGAGGGAETGGGAGAADADADAADRDADGAVDWDAVARALAVRMSETCEGVEMRAAATPVAVFLWERLREARRALARGDAEAVARVGREVRSIEARLEDAEAEYAAWTREAAMEAEEDGDGSGDDGTAAEDAAAEDAREAGARAREREPRPGTIVRPPAPPLPPATVAVKPRAPKEETQLVKRRAVSSRDAKRRMVDVDKWAKARESESERGDNSKAAIEARNARQIEAWRASRAREGVSGSTNPNFVPVGDWRANVEAARAKARLEEFRERRENERADAVSNPVSTTPMEPPSLPPDWRAFVDATSGKMYYGNVKTKETTWDRPT